MEKVKRAKSEVIGRKYKIIRYLLNKGQRYTGYIKEWHRWVYGGCKAPRD